MACNSIQLHYEHEALKQIRFGWNRHREELWRSQCERGGRLQAHCACGAGIRHCAYFCRLSVAPDPSITRTRYVRRSSSHIQGMLKAKSLRGLGSPLARASRPGARPASELENAVAKAEQVEWADFAGRTGRELAGANFFCSTGCKPLITRVKLQQGGLVPAPLTR
jgi:hypothetical protein